MALNKGLSLFSSKIFGTKLNFNDLIAKLCAVSGSNLKIKDLKFKKITREKKQRKKKYGFKNTNSRQSVPRH